MDIRPLIARLEKLERWRAEQETRDSNGPFYPGVSVTLADDTAISFIPKQSAGVILIGFESGAFTIQGLVMFRATSTPVCAIIAGLSGLEATTGALTGTTGTDGKLTVSAHTDGKIYIENRTSNPQGINYTMFG